MTSSWHTLTVTLSTQQRTTSNVNTSYKTNNFKVTEINTFIFAKNTPTDYICTINLTEIYVVNLVKLRALYMPCCLSIILHAPVRTIVINLINMNCMIKETTDGWKQERSLGHCISEQT